MSVTVSLANSADLCRAEGWGVGTVLQSLPSGPGTDAVRMEITGIGRNLVLGVLAAIVMDQGDGSINWEPWDGDEEELVWDLAGRTWRPVTFDEGVDHGTPYARKREEAGALPQPEDWATDQPVDPRGTDGDLHRSVCR